MIYIFVGNDIKKKNERTRKIVGEQEFIKVPSKEISEDLILNQAESTSLFGEFPVFIFDNILYEQKISLSKENLQIIKNSRNIFIFLEDKLTLLEQKKYAKYADIEIFEEKIKKLLPKVNTFSIADSFSRRDKISTWTLYIEALENTDPEAIAGILFWKIKSMILTGNKNFSINELKNQSSEIVSIYHLAHRGELDMRIGLEHFILSSLSK